MKGDFFKALGVILSFLWLAAVGQFALLGFFFAEEAPKAQWVGLRLGYILLYIILGIGPVSGFILLMKKLHQPISQVAVTVIGVFGAIPIILIVAYLTLAK